MAFVRRVSIFRREIIERISPAGLEVLLRGAERISEGQVTSGGRFYGSIMLTIDFGSVAQQVRDEGDVATASRLARQLEQERGAMEQVRRLALREARAIAGQPIARPATEVKVRTRGAQVLLDVDLEGDVASGKKDQGTA